MTVRRTHRAQWPTLGALALTGLAAVLFWRRFNAAPPGRGLLYPTDLLHYFYPRGEAVARRLLAGELPLWNPRLCAGIPELATAQSAVLSPQTWIFAPLPPELGLPLRIFVECLLGGAFAVLFLRRLGLDALAATLGGALYLSTCLLGQSFWPPMISTLLWLPAQLCCVESLSRRWSWRAWLGLVAATALQAVAGFPQFALYSLQLVAAYAPCRALALRGANARGLVVLAGTAAAVALGLGVAGAQLLPTAELAALGTRAGVLGAGEIHYLGDPGAMAALRNSVDPAPKLLAFDYLRGGNYLGIATLLLLALGAASADARLVGPLLVLGALGLLLSGGYQGWGAELYRAYAELPLVGRLRSPERQRIVTLVCAIALACIGLDRVGRTAPALSRRRRGAAAGAVLLCAAVVATVGADGAPWRAALALLLILGALAAGTRRWPRRAAQVLLLALVLGDVLHATAPYGSLRSPLRGWTDRLHLLGSTILDADGLARLRERAGGQRIEVEQVLPGALADAEHLMCREPLVPREWAKVRRLPPIERARVYDATSVAWVVGLEIEEGFDLAQVASEVERRFRSGADPAPAPPRGLRVTLLPKPRALPRAYWVGDATLRPPAQALEHVKRGDVDLRTTVLLDGDRRGRAARRSRAPLGAAEIRLHAPERVEIRVDAPRDGILVLTDVWYPGWRASVNGRDAEVLRANGLFRAVRVPAGRSDVVFEYRPASFRRGLALSALSLGLAVAIPLAARRWRRPSASIG